MENETISITFNGEVDGNGSEWMKWYNDAKKIIRLLGYEPTHAGIDSTTLKSGKVMMLKKSEKKIISSIESGDKIKYIDVKSGEVYEMDRTEFPLFYAAKDNPASTFKTLKVIKKIY